MYHDSEMPPNLSERLDPEVRALLAMMAAQNAPPLESQDPIEAVIAGWKG